MQSTTRRRFLAILGAAIASAAIPRRARAALAAGGDIPHPTPRPGVTGEHVLSAAQLTMTPELIPLFDGVRAIPAVVDGIRCNCGCAGSPGFRSLLSCYEGDGMARGCTICQGQGRLAVRLHRAGRSLDEIRTAIDAKFA